MKKLFACFIALLAMVCSCSDDGAVIRRGSLKSLVTQFCQELTFRQRLNALLIIADNDTAKVCKALVMPRQTLLRLSKEETYPTSMAKKKVEVLYVNSVISHLAYMDSLSRQDDDKKDWLMHNSINEPINPIWEQIMEATNE